VKTEILPSAADVAGRAAELVLSAASTAIESRGTFSLVLAGGTTPAACYDRLAASEADWGLWHIYFGDERCLEPADPQRNSAMAAAHLTDRVPIPSHQVHAIPAERGPEAAAHEYTTLIRAALPFDLVLLGMGEDGHTASLFPGHRHPADALVVPVHGAPKPPSERVSLGAAALRRCRQLVMLVTGAGKRPAMRLWRSDRDLPLAQFAGMDNAVLLLDEDANP
jgi:6-phosphogluconolactonase